jgi:hypothetical protein
MRNGFPPLGRDSNHWKIFCLDSTIHKTTHPHFHTQNLQSTSFCSSNFRSSDFNRQQKLLQKLFPHQSYSYSSLRPRALRFQRLHHACPQFLEDSLLGQSLWKTERQQLRPNQKWYQLQVLPGRTFGTPFDCLLHCFRCVPERLLGVFQTVQCGVCTRVLVVLVQMFAVCGGSDGTDAVQRPEQICLGPNEATIKTHW